MPLVMCPECGAHTRVSSENLGRSIGCSKCPHHFIATAEPDSWTRFLAARHPAGYRAGLGLLLMMVVLTVVIIVEVTSQGGDLYGALFGRQSLPWARALFLIAFASLALGSFLIYRYRRASSYWPPRR
jgi:hypothetical protein